ncbi:MAG TPA: recombination regulator RecX [Tissierellia bacterium]|mgnify:CR=1 FL=1|nr:recombination regulator RecX [Tissierellia bacterium]
MKVTKIEYQKKNKDRFNIYLDDEYAFAVDVNVLIKYSLKKDMVLDQEFIREILKSEERQKVYNYGIYILSKSAKSEKEVRRKMQDKGFDPQLIDDAINELKEKKYLDDEKYCEMFIRHKINISKDGVRKIKEALYFKGIDREVIEEKLANISEEDEEERAYLLGVKKLHRISEGDSWKKRMKLSNYLLGKGFEYDVVNRTVNRLLGAK